MRHGGPIVVDLQAVQSPTYRGRGIGRYALQWCVALERARPELVARYLLSSRFAPPGDLGPLLETGKLCFADDLDAFAPTDRVVHSLAPFDPASSLRELWPRRPDRARVLRSATVYDCIPALDPEHELAGATQRTDYITKLEMVRSVAHVLTIAKAVASDLRRVLGASCPVISVVGAAPSAAFVPAVDPHAVHRRVRSLLPQITGPYVLYPTGSHPRKNNERLVEAFAAIPHQDRREWRLVLGGDLPSSTSHHLHHLAARLGIQGSLVTTGFVEDELLVALYQAAALVCFPSLAEGFGLPVAEALACGVPVIAADRPPLDDLIPAHRRFDPDDTAAIATALVTAMRTSASTAATGAGRSLDGAAALTRPSTWTEVANRSGQAFDAMLEATDVIRLRPSAPRRTISRRRIAFVTPLPPAATGIAHYSYRLAEELLATGRIDLDLFSDGPTPHQQAPLGASLYAAQSLIAVEEVVGGYDDVVYAFGNSHHHLGAIAMLRQRPGTVIAHDVRLTNLYRHESGDPGLVPGGLGRKVHELYADTLPESIGVDGSIRPEDEDRFGVLMAREVVKLSTRYLVSSQAARTLAALDASIDTNLAVLDFAMESPVVGALPLRGPTKSTEPIVATFGIVDPVKEPDLLLTAFTRIRSALVVAGLDSPKLVFVGPVSDALHQHLVRRADELDLTSNVVLTGSVSSTEYRRWLAQATVAVQLRRRTQGEASAAIGECLASGLPTIVTDIGWSGELPDSAVVKVPRSVPAHELADVVTALVLDSGARSSLSRAGLEIAAERTFTRTASRLLEILDD